MSNKQLSLCVYPKTKINIMLIINIYLFTCSKAAVGLELRTAVLRAYSNYAKLPCTKAQARFSFRWQTDIAGLLQRQLRIMVEFAVLHANYNTCSSITRPIVNLMVLFHCMVRYGSAWLVTVRLSLGRFAFPLQFSTAKEWAGLFTCRYSCATSTAVTS